MKKATSYTQFFFYINANASKKIVSVCAVKKCTFVRRTILLYGNSFGSIYAYFLMYQYGTAVDSVLLLSFKLLSITLRNICMYVVLTHLLILTEIKILLIKLILKGNVNKYTDYL